jgi:hypothetical protein
LAREAVKPTAHLLAAVKVRQEVHLLFLLSHPLAEGEVEEATKILDYQEDLVVEQEENLAEHLLEAETLEVIHLLKDFPEAPEQELRAAGELQ